MQRAIVPVDMWCCYSRCERTAIARCCSFAYSTAGVERVTTADEIDPAYAAAVRTAQRAGVEVMAFRTLVSAERLTLADELPVCL